MSLRSILGACVLASLNLAPAAAQTSSVSNLADRYVEQFSSHYPAQMMFYGMAYGKAGIFNQNDPQDIANWRVQQAEILHELKSIDPDHLSGVDQLTYANVREMIEADLQQVVCRNELWSLDYYTGWQTMLPMYFDGYVESRKGTLDRPALDQWADAIVAYLAQEQENLADGRTLGYSAPRSLAIRVAKQVDNLGRDGVPDLAGPIAELENDALTAHWVELRQTKIEPALRHFAAYLREDYAVQARTEHSIAFNPDGIDCFRAKLRLYSSLDLDPAALLEEAEQTRLQSQDRFMELGEEIYGFHDRASILKAIQSDRSADFQGNDDEIMAAAQEMADRLIDQSRHLFPDLPENGVHILSYDEASIEAGARASYAGPQDDSYNGRYYLNPQSRDARSAFQLESTTVHEVAPGHHMQSMISLFHNRTMEDRHAANSLSFIPAYVEGWANYAEGLALEQGLFSDPRSELVELSTAGRSYVGELRLHLGGSDAEFRALYAEELENGSVTEDYLDAALDRLAMWAGHNSSYTIGGQFILRMRELAKATLAACFSLPDFHETVLQNGSVPLWFIERRVKLRVDEKMGECTSNGHGT